MTDLPAQPNPTTGHWKHLLLKTGQWISATGGTDPRWSLERMTPDVAIAELYAWRDPGSGTVITQERIGGWSNADHPPPGMVVAPAGPDVHVTVDPATNPAPVVNVSSAPATVNVAPAVNVAATAPVVNITVPKQTPTVTQLTGKQPVTNSLLGGGTLALGGTKDVVVPLGGTMPSADYAAIPTLMGAGIANVTALGVVSQTPTAVTVRLKALALLTADTVTVVVAATHVAAP